MSARTDKHGDYPSQEWLLNNVQKYRDNYRATLKHNPGGLQSIQSTLRWQFNSAKREAHRIGLLDKEGRIK
jgi:hypothetical protein